MATGAKSRHGWGGKREKAGRRVDNELTRMVADLTVSLGNQGDARVQTDQVVNGVVVWGKPWSREPERGVRPKGVREASRMVARRWLADRPLSLKLRAKQEAALAERIRRAYHRSVAIQIL